MVDNATVEAHLGLAHAIAATHVQQWGGYVDRQDVRSEAYLALVLAAATFRPDAGMQFANYVGQQIRYALADYGRKVMHERGFQRCTSKPGSPHERRVELVPLDDCERATSAPMLEMFAELERSDQHRQLRRLSLTAREQAVLDGLLANDTQADIARRLSLGESRISQLTRAVVTKARHQMETRS